MSDNAVSDAQRASALAVRPMRDLVLVRIDPVNVVTDSGLHLAERTFMWTERATVLAVGPGARHPRTGVRMSIDDIKVGDRVAFSHKPSNDQPATEKLYGKGAVFKRRDEIEAVLGAAMCANGDCPCQSGEAACAPVVTYDEHGNVIVYERGSVAYMDGI